MTKEINVKDFEEAFDEAFDEIDVSANDKSEPNSVSFQQILDSYEESREQY